jgi:hypothetical protein
LCESLFETLFETLCESLENSLFNPLRDAALQNRLVGYGFLHDRLLKN